MLKFEFNKLFKVVPWSPKVHKTSLFDNNLSSLLSDRADLGGPGVYFIFKLDREFIRLIYIGEHKTKAAFHDDRVRKHLRTLTFKFNHAMTLGVSGNRACSVDQLEDAFETRFSLSGCDDSELWHYVKQNLLKLPHRISGNLPKQGSFLRESTEHVSGSGDETSLRRFQYACHFWHEVEGLEESAAIQRYLNTNYLFAWSSLPTSERAKQTETDLIDSLLPVVNDEMNRHPKASAVKTMMESKAGPNVWSSNTSIENVLESIQTQIDSLY